MISPEGCASILWRTADKAADAAEAMRITAADLKQLGVIDRIVPEPVGGAHREPGGDDRHRWARRSARSWTRSRPLPRDEVRAERREKFLASPERSSFQRTGIATSSVTDTKRAAELLPPPSRINVFECERD